MDTSTLIKQSTEKVELNPHNIDTSKYQFVNSLDNLKTGVIYTTKNYELFKPLDFNRGEKGGVVENRVKKILAIIENDDFDMDDIHVKVNMRGYIIDGTHRYEALKRKNLTVNFMVWRSERYNLENLSHVLNGVARYNSVNPSWSGNVMYASAFHYGEPAAIAINNLREMLRVEYGVHHNIFTAGRLVALAQKASEELRKNKLREVYCDEKLAKKLESKKFLKELDIMAKMILFVKKDNPMLKSWHVVRTLMPLVWEHNRDLGKTFKNMKKRGFQNLKDYKAKTIRERCIDILRMDNI